MFQDMDRNGKVLILLGSLLGLVALLSLTHTQYGENPTIAMSSQAMRPARVWQSMQPMQARPSLRFMQPTRAEPDRSAMVDDMESQFEVKQARREMLSGLVFALAAAAAARDEPAFALSPVDIKDYRDVKNKGFDLIYEARDLDLPQNVRDGMTQARGSVDATKKRILESAKRIETDVIKFVKLAYWTKAKEELRGQLGFLRFDLRNLAGKDKAKKAVVSTFLTAVEKLDFAIRQKKMDAALAAYDEVEAALGALKTTLL